MVFDGGDFDENRNYAAARIAAFRAASCVKILGKGVIRVVHRVDDARENNNLGKKDYRSCFSIQLVKFFERHHLSQNGDFYCEMQDSVCTQDSELLCVPI
jgi:hypothetical protein